MVKRDNESCLLENPKDVKWKNSRIVNELDPREIETVKSGPGKDMIIFGSGSIVSQLTQHGLIDEYQVVVCPVLLGNGRPRLTSVTKNSRLELAEAKVVPIGRHHASLRAFELDLCSNVSSQAQR